MQNTKIFKVGNWAMSIAGGLMVSAIVIAIIAVLSSCSNSRWVGGNQMTGHHFYKYQKDSVKVNIKKL